MALQPGAGVSMLAARRNTASMKRAMTLLQPSDWHYASQFSFFDPPAHPMCAHGILSGPFSNAALHKGNGLLLEWTPHLRYAMGS